MPGTLGRAFVALSLLAASPALAADPALAATYPELAPERLLPPLLGELRRTLRDPRSITDFVLCPPTKIKYEGGRPVRWAVLFSLNARNAYGGYAGVTMYAAVFRPGKRVNVSQTQLAGTDGLDGLINNAIAKKMRDCPFVPDAEIQRLLADPAALR